MEKYLFAVDSKYTRAAAMRLYSSGFSVYFEQVYAQYLDGHYSAS